MPRTHGAKEPILFAQMLYTHEATLSELAQINGIYLLMCTRP